jgi:antitoxin (DNA-binding transcriptional repressor) of toxin-antitoxin stability system
MVTVGISELKNKLSAYIDKVRAGETVLVLDRGDPVAELRAPVLSDDERIAHLVRKGIIRPAKGKLPDDFFDRPRPKLPPGVSIVDAVLAEREEGW